MKYLDYPPSVTQNSDFRPRNGAATARLAGTLAHMTHATARPQPGSRRNLKKVLAAAIGAALLGALAARAFRHPRPGTSWPQVACIIGWVLFAIYWAASATDDPARSAESRSSRRVHEILMNVAYALILVPLALPLPIPVLQYRFLPSTPLASALGLVLQAGSFALAIWARRTLGRNWSGRIEIKKHHQLVRSGPYRMLRHPIYTAVLGMAAGTAITIGKTHVLIGIAVIVFAYVRKIRLEEAALSTAFGADYREYRNYTWGFIPGLY